MYTDLYQFSVYFSVLVNTCKLSCNCLAHISMAVVLFCSYKLKLFIDDHLSTCTQVGEMPLKVTQHVKQQGFSVIETDSWPLDFNKVG